MNGILIARFSGEYEGWTITKVENGFFAGHYVLRDEENIIHVNCIDLGYVLSWIQ